MIQIKQTNQVNVGPTSRNQESQALVNNGQYGSNIGQGQGPNPNIKLGDKEEFGQLITNLETSNFNFYVRNLLLECYWVG